MRDQVITGASATAKDAPLSTPVANPVLASAAKAGTVTIETGAKGQEICQPMTVTRSDTGYNVKGGGISMHIPDVGPPEPAHVEMIAKLKAALNPPAAGTRAGAAPRVVKDVDKTQKAKTTTFSPVHQTVFNERFKTGASNSGVSAGKAYLTGSDQTNFLVAFGAESAVELQRDSGLKGKEIDGKIGGQTCDAVAVRVLDAPQFNFNIQSPEHAVTCAKAAEFLLETIESSTTFTADQKLDIRKKLEAALAAMPTAMKEAVGKLAEAMPDAASGVAETKSLLKTASAKGTIAPVPVDVAGLPVPALIALASQDGAMSGPDGAAIKTRLAHPITLLSVIETPGALDNPNLAGAVEDAIALLTGDQLPQITAEPLKLPEKIKGSVLLRINGLAGAIAPEPKDATVASPTKLAALTILTAAAKALYPKTSIPQSVTNAVKDLIGAASAEQLTGRDAGGTGVFMAGLKALYGGTLPTDIGSLINSEKRVELGKTDKAVETGFQTIMTALDGGLTEREEEKIVSLFNALGEAGKNKAMSSAGKDSVGALVERLLDSTETDKNPDATAAPIVKNFETMMSQLDGNDRKQLLTQLSKLPAGAVSSKAAVKIAALTAKYGGDVKFAPGLARKMFLEKLRGAPAADARAMLVSMAKEPALAAKILTDKADFATDKAIFATLRNAFPTGDVAKALGTGLPDRQQKIDFMMNLVNTVADRDAAPADRAWAKSALEQATREWRGPLRDSDLSQLQSHIDTIKIDRDSNAADAQGAGNQGQVDAIANDPLTHWLTDSFGPKVLTKEKSIN
ncbi:MAG: hypothetical protein H7338_25385 [Candidatus Sericytochromatia bacterium]|nr:hypothetical protein [Candidatus Sericytochromatia bacterium]